MRILIAALRSSFLNRLALAGALIIPSLGCSSEGNSGDGNMAGAAPANVFSYRDTRSELVEIFDFNRRAGIQDGPTSLADPGNASSEFSGPLDTCNDPRFYCMITFLHIAIPRTGTLSRWTTSGLSCDATATSEPGTLAVLCRVDGRDASVRFQYSNSRGITSYQRLCGTCRPEQYVLVGNRGMFAREP